MMSAVSLLSLPKFILIRPSLLLISKEVANCQLLKRMDLYLKTHKRKTIAHLIIIQTQIKEKLSRLIRIQSIINHKESQIILIRKVNIL